MNDDAKDHCPKCRSTDLWEIAGMWAFECMDCHFVFKTGEALVGVDLDI